MSVTTPFPLGVFVGGLSTDPTAEASVEAQFARFTSTMGTTPQFMDGFINQSAPITTWASDASYTAYAWQTSGIAKNVIPIIGLPMASATDAGKQDAVFKAFSAGTYDSVLKGIVSAWANAGFATQYIRVGYEGNDSVPWYAGSDPQTQADWVAAFQHIATVMRSVPGADVKIVWNPNLQAGNTVVVPNIYPGDQYVDVIAGDIYSPTSPRDLYDWSLNNGTYDSTFQQWFSNPVNRTHYWQYPAANQWQQVSDGQSNTFGLTDLISFAKAHGKPIGIAETGAGGDGSAGPIDDPAFPQWLATTLANSGATVAFVNIWDSNPGDGNWDFSSPSQPKPLEAAAWSKYFGAATSSSVVTVGTGPDQFQLIMSEDAYNGNATFTVSIDGVQIGGTLTATSSHTAGATQVFNINGAFGTGTHNVKVNFLNDAYGGPGLDRNLYVNAISYNGTPLAPANASLQSNGAVSFATATADVVLGTGPDSFVFTMSEDAYLGNAQFTISIDGVQQGGTLSAAALHASGGGQNFTVNGTFGAGAHAATVKFINDASSSAGDRNLYVNAASYNGASLTPASAPLYSNGAANFAAGNTATTSLAATGSDSFVFNMAEDPNNGDAQFTIKVDGVQQGGVRTTSALHASGQSQAVVVNGAFGAGAHTAVVTFLNDLYGPNGQDRNLYINSASYDGVALTPGSGALYNNGSMTFVRPAADTLTLQMTENAYQGDAQAQISIDGKMLGTVLVAALDGGTPQAVSFAGNFGAGAHTIGVNFLNDASGPGGDRNLYVKGISFDGAAHTGATSNQYAGGLVNLNI